MLSYKAPIKDIKFLLEDVFDYYGHYGIKKVVHLTKVKLQLLKVLKKLINNMLMADGSLYLIQKVTVAKAYHLL